jgi:hypothetical protein
MCVHVAGSMLTREDATDAAAQAALAHAMGGGMRLTLTQREADARQVCTLPCLLPMLHAMQPSCKCRKDHTVHMQSCVC